MTMNWMTVPSAWTEAPAGSWLGRVKQRPFWLVFAVYALIFFSSFSIAGIEFASILLMTTSALHLWRADDAEIAPRWIVLPFVVLVGAELLSALANPLPLRTLSHMRGDYRIFLPLAMLPALARVDASRLLRVFAICVAFSALYGAIQFYAGVDWFRPEGDKHITRTIISGSAVFHGKGTFSHHLTYSGFMLINASFFLALALCDSSRARFTWLAGSLAAGVGVAVSMGRSGWLGTIAGVSVLVLMLPRRFSHAILGVGFLCAAVIITTMATGWLQKRFDSPNNPVLVKRMLSASPINDRDRLYLWEAGWEGFLENPIVGVGRGNERFLYEQHRVRVAERHGGHQFLNSASAGIHSFYLQVAYNNGVVGLLAILWLYGSVFIWCAHWIRRAANRKDLGFERGLLWGAAAGLAGTLVAGVFVNNYFDAEVGNMIGIAIGLALHAGLTVRDASFVGVSIET